MKLVRLRASFRFLACHALIFQKNQQFQKIIKIWLTGLGTTVAIILESSSSFSKIPQLQTPSVSTHKNLP